MLKSAALILISLSCLPLARAAEEKLHELANPMLGTATLWDKKDLGFTPTFRTWGAEVFPGSSLPNAMVQLTPVTTWRSGSGYQYEDKNIQAFVHTSKGHWNLCHVPFLPVTGEVNPDDFSSPFSHEKESAKPGFYQVLLERYGINAELTSTLRCGFHKYTFPEGQAKKMIADLTRSNEGVRGWEIKQEGDNVFRGYQQTGERMSFYAISNHKITGIESVKKGEREVSVVTFADENKPLELQIGFSFTSVENAKANLEKEMLGKDFAKVRAEAGETWDALLGKIKVTGGTDRQKRLFYTTLYRSFLWPALRSDANGDFSDRSGRVFNKGFQYYTDPSLWDDYRNKLVLLGMLSPQVTTDVIKSMTERGKRSGFMPTFFHGDHAAPFIAGSYLRGIRDFDLPEAYKLMMKNATVGGRIRPFLNEYIEKGYVPEHDIEKPVLETKATAGVTKTLEYAYDDYSLALLSKELGNTADYDMLMKRVGNYKNVFDPSTGLMRGKLANGEWIKNFDPEVPYYEYMYREANAWQSSFFAPHDVEGLIGLYPSPDAFEKKLDDLFSIPWKGYEAYNMSVFIGQYCHGNQPDHNFPFLYHFVGKPEKSQAIIDKCLEEFYDMGKEKLSYAGMDDAGEMSAWYVFCAMGFYPFSPADPEFITTVPIFDKVELKLGDKTATVRKEGSGPKITEITSAGKKIEDWFIPWADLEKGGEVLIKTSSL